MKICVVGAGAIGGFMAVRLEQAGHTVSVVARGPHLAAIKTRGLKLIEAGYEQVARSLIATDVIRDLGMQDVVLLGLKAHQIEPIVDDLSVLIGSETVMVTLQNGIPWWYFQSHGGRWEGTQLESVDPGGIITKHIATERIVGCVVYPAATIVEPGIIHHEEGNRFSIGELDGSSSSRCKELAAAIGSSGLRAPVRSNIRQEIWVKLLGNLAFNPVSALTKASMVEIAMDPDARSVVQTMMEEAYAVAKALGVEIPISIEQRLAGAQKIGEHKTSMLQDVEAAKPIEIGGLVGSVLELGSLLGVPMPYTNTVYACTKLLAQKMIVGNA